MWTPRRVLLLLGGTLLFAGIYLSYSRFLGWLDGLPQLPAAFLEASSGTYRRPDRHTPTIQRLIDAFGENCQEKDPNLYEVQFGFLNGESYVVLAARNAPRDRPTQLVFSPFSLAVFGKPQPEGARATAEVTEITTFHSDRAVLEFDRPVGGQAGMSEWSKAKLLRVELISDPAATWKDPRRGTVHIFNNQRSADPSDALILLTPGPLFYRDPKGPDAKPDGAPDIWTDASVEIIDRQNLPRGYLEPTPPTAQAAGEDLRTTAAVREVLNGHRSPPPTATAIGMRVYLDSGPPPAGTNGPPAPKKASGGVSAVRRIELLEKVLFNLWVDTRQGAAVSPGQSEDTERGSEDTEPGAGSALSIVDPPTATAAVVGGLFFPAQTAHRLNRALLQIETLGSFAYDVPKTTARFDVFPKADPKLPNDVQVHRILPQGGSQRLFSEILEIEFVRRGVTPPPNGPDPPRPNRNGKPEPSGGLSYQSLRASAVSPGRTITVTSAEVDEDGREAEGLEIYCKFLVHTQADNRTIFKGTPVYAVRRNPPREDGGEAGSNILIAGTPERPAEMIMGPPEGTTPARATPGPTRATPGLTRATPAAPPRPAPSNNLRVKGPGRLEIYDPDAAAKDPAAGKKPAAGANTIHATWETSLVQTSEQIQGRKMDVLTFIDQAMFEDKQAGSWIRAKELKLWLEGSGANAGPGPSTTGGGKADRKAEPGGSPLPHRLLALGNVTCKSTDFQIVATIDSNGRIVRSTDKLDMLFIDKPPPRKIEPAKSPASAAITPPPAGSPSPPAGGPGPMSTDPMPATPANPMPQAAPPEPEPEPAKPKPPMILQSRVVHTLVGRFRAPPTEPTPSTKAPRKSTSDGKGPPATSKEPAKPAADGKAPPPGAVRYALEKLQCEGDVVAHQDPAPPENPQDPVKAQGLDVAGQTLYVDSTPDGSVMTVTGTEDRLAEVHHEGKSIEGPNVVINQLENQITVKGRGSLVMPAGSELNGGALNTPPSQPEAKPDQPEPPAPPLKVHWLDGMDFSGAKKWAEFRGRVEAVQADGDATVRCHTMQVVFDRPIFFNQVGKSEESAGTKSPRQVTAAYITAAVAGKTADAAALSAPDHMPGRAATVEALHRAFGKKGPAVARVATSEAKGRAVVVTETFLVPRRERDGSDRAVLVVTLAKLGVNWRLKTVAFDTEDGAKKAIDDARRVDGATESENAKIEKVYCYPAPADIRDEPRGSDKVIYQEVSRNQDKQIEKIQILIAQGLTMTAQARDVRGELCQEVVGDGPGTVRIWQLGQKDAAGPTNPPPTPTPGATSKATEPETEMKLTVVQFSGRMVIRDTAKIYQEAVFYTEQGGGTIEVIHAPAKEPSLQVDWHHLPPGSVRLTCVDKLTVSSYTPPNPAPIQKKDARGNVLPQKDEPGSKARQNPPPVQRMDARGNVSIQTDENIGWGEQVVSDGPLFTLYGAHPDHPGQDGFAWISSRYRENHNSAKKIIYDRVKGTYQGESSFEGRFQQGGTSQPAKTGSQPAKLPAQPGTPIPQPSMGMPMR